MTKVLGVLVAWGSARPWRNPGRRRGRPARGHVDARAVGRLLAGLG